MKSKKGRHAVGAAIAALILSITFGLYRLADSHERAQDELDHAMVQAVYQNDAPEVQRLLELGANPNEPDTYPKLSSVTRYLNRLLHHKSVPDPGILPLFASFSNSHMDTAAYSNGEVVRALLDYGGDPNVRDETNSTPLMLACKNGNHRSVCALAEHGAQVNIRDNHGMTPLLMAANVRDLQAITALVEHGADVNGSRESGNTPLMAAVLYYNEPFVETMLRAHCDVNKRSTSGETALVMARRIGSAKIERLLVRAGAK